MDTVYSNNIQEQTFKTKLNQKNMISLYNENKIKRNNKFKKKNTIKIDDYFDCSNINDDKNTSHHHNIRRSVRSSSSKSVGSLDFENLFVNQPHNNYFPSINLITKTNKIDNILSPSLSSSKHSSSSISFDMKPSEVRDIQDNFAVIFILH
jgi:hypothetical protein